MNLTLAVDPDILREARKIAIDEDTSVSALIRRPDEALSPPRFSARPS